MEEGIPTVNPLLDLLQESGFRFDPSAFSPMCRLFLNASLEQREEFTARAKMMPYPAFLKSRYWGIVCGWVLSKSSECRRCRSSLALNVHHIGYDIHGEEHRRLDGLEVLCRNCHAELHGQSTPEQIAESMLRRSRSALVKPSHGTADRLRFATEQLRETAVISWLRRKMQIR